MEFKKAKFKRYTVEEFTCPYCNKINQQPTEGFDCWQTVCDYCHESVEIELEEETT